MEAPRPWRKVGIVIGGLFVAIVIACIAVALRQLGPQTPEMQASSGMYAFSDLLLGAAVFGVIALAPLALALYWLRPVARFWSVLLWCAMLLALTGLWALVANVVSNHSTNSWMLLAQTRVIIMPLTASALLACALFAPRLRDRWFLLAAGVSDGVIFTGVSLSLLFFGRH